MTSMTLQRQLIGLALWLALGFAVAAIGAAASLQAATFYSALVRPEWAPPSWLFGPVWTLLYVMMSVAAWLVWRREAVAANRRVAIGWYLTQLVVNALWSWLFFAWQLGGLAMLDIVLLWLLIVVTMLAFRRVSGLAALLLLPYLLWVSFAAVLNYAIWQLNPELLGGGI